ncbi:MAG: GNAT family N-acetyltransferase [Cyanobacteria bacterium J06600_6]
MQDWSEVYELGDTYRQQQQWQSAAIAFQRAIELRPDFFWSYHHLGDVYTHLQQWQPAEIAYSKAVQLNPQFFWSWHNLGDVLTKSQQWQSAAIAYKKAVQLDPQFFWSWHNLGDVQTKLQQWQQAISSYFQGIFLQPEHELSYQKLGNAFKQQGNLIKTIKYYRQIIQAPPSNSIFERLQTQPQKLGEAIQRLTKHHQIQGAIAVCYMVLELQPTNLEVLDSLSSLLHKNRQLEQAIATSQQRLNERSTSSLLIQPAASLLSSPVSITGRIAIKTDKAVTPEQLNDLCTAVGWQSRPAHKLAQAISSSFRYISAWHIDREQRLVGFARAVSDGVYQATLLDIAVHPDFQGRGLGKTLVETLTQQLHVAKIADITLFASPHVADFYHQLGFISQPHNLQWMLWCPSSEIN